MNQCQSCGTGFAPGTAFCPSCGAPTAGAPAAPPQSQQYAPPAPPAQPGAGYQAPPQPQQYGQPAPGGYPPPGAPPTGEANTGMAVLSYLGILVLVPLLTNAWKQSRFNKFHTNQGLVFAIFCIAWGIVYGILLAIVTAIFATRVYGVTVATGTGYGLFVAILGILWLIPLALMIMGIISAVQGTEKELPVIGKFKLLK